MPEKPENSAEDPDMASASDDADGAQERKPFRTKSDAPEKKHSLLKETAIIVVCVLLLTFVVTTFVGRQYTIPSPSMENTLIGCSETGCPPGAQDDRIWVDKLTYQFNDPRPGDVVVFKAPSDDWNNGQPYQSIRSSNPIVRGAQTVLSWFGFQRPDEYTLVKRVIAVGGQTVECRNDKGGLRVDGKLLNEPYVDRGLQEQGGTAVGQSGPLPPCFYGQGYEEFGPVKVPDDRVWVMGDNRGASADSRYHQGDEFQGMVPRSDIRGKARFILYPFSRFGGISDHNPQG